jgi:hypothetical protein
MSRAAVVWSDGGQCKLSLAVDWTHDSVADLRHLRRAHGVRVFVGVLGQQEWERIGVPDVCGTGQRYGLHVVFLPLIRDGVPENLDVVIRFGRLVLQLARAGHHVCIGGRDRPRRAHIMAAAALILAGMSVRDVLALIRRARPRALDHEEETLFLWRLVMRARETGYLTDHQAA